MHTGHSATDTTTGGTSTRETTTRQTARRCGSAEPSTSRPSTVPCRLGGLPALRRHGEHHDDRRSEAPGGTRDDVEHGRLVRMRRRPGSRWPRCCG